MKTRQSNMHWRAIVVFMIGAQMADAERETRTPVSLGVSFGWYVTREIYFTRFQRNCVKSG